MPYSQKTHTTTYFRGWLREEAASSPQKSCNSRCLTCSTTLSWDPTGLHVILETSCWHSWQSLALGSPKKQSPQNKSQILLRTNINRLWGATYCLALIMRYLKDCSREVAGYWTIFFNKHYEISITSPICCHKAKNKCQLGNVVKSKGTSTGKD